MEWGGAAGGVVCSGLVFLERFASSGLVFWRGLWSGLELERRVTWSGFVQSVRGAVRGVACYLEWGGAVNQRCCLLLDGCGPAI
eukprot:600137-Pelagomonas_calceolata.AAC.1